MAQFEHKTRRGVVCGSEVVVKPIPFKLALKMRQTDEDAARGELALEVIAKCVTMADGSPVDVDDLDDQQVAELLKFISDGWGDVSDFTSPR